MVTLWIFSTSCQGFWS